MFKFIKSIFKSAKDGVQSNPQVREFERKHKRVGRFIEGRFNPNEKFGLTLTIGAVFTLLFLWFFFSILQDIIGKDPLYNADLRVINLIALYRVPLLNKIMNYITYLGKWEVIFLGVLFVCIILALQKKWKYFWALIISVAGGQIMANTIKNILHRARPPLSSALIFENSFSFPSGHSLVAVTFYGFLTYLAFIHLKSKLLRFITIVAGIVIITAIGFSRIYLGVHFPTDVLGGYFAGGAWVTAVITTLEIRKKSENNQKQQQRVNEGFIIVISIILFTFWVVFWLFLAGKNPLTPPSLTPETAAITQNDIPSNLFNDLPRTSETITGQPMEPINIIVVGLKSELDRTFTTAGWNQTDPVDVKSSFRIAYDTIFSKPYPSAPGTPSFWDQKPNQFAYEQPTGNNPKQRYHIHFWQSPFTLNGVPIWFATAHFDKSVVFKNYIIPTHEIDPDIDTQREKVLGDLVNTGKTTRVQEFQLVPRELGRNAAGSLFFTDGKAEVIYLKP